MREHLQLAWTTHRALLSSASQLFGAIRDRRPASALDLAGLRRMLFHSALVGIGAGVMGALFFAGLELTERLLLEGLAGYEPLRAHGEAISSGMGPVPFRPWVLLFLPALGGLAAGLVMRAADETCGGGTDAVIDAFHRDGGAVRRRVLWIKPLASILTLGTGGAGGREGPTMLIGGAIGSLVSRLLGVGPRERRILLVAGVAAGMAAVFRTPLGASLLAVEVLYRDGFEADALIPSVLSSVVAYSLVISIFGESTLFAHAPRYPFTPAHLPLYGLLALITAGVAAAFVRTMNAVKRMMKRTKLPRWARPALGGLALGVLSTPIIWFVGERIGVPGQGLGLLGGGYGAAQLAISGSSLLPGGWEAVEILLLLAVAKLLASSLTIGSGGSAGDFAPSLALGALIGGAFGKTAALLLDDPGIDPGAFALVGMGAFYGGIAHVPLASLVLVCELAGSYDLLVPLMLAEGVAFIALRNRSLYTAQLPTPRDSPQHRRDVLADVTRGLCVGDVMRRRERFETFALDTNSKEMEARVYLQPDQLTFPVINSNGAIAGLVTFEVIRSLMGEVELREWALATDIMQGPISLDPKDELALALRLMRAHELAEIPVLNGPNIDGFVCAADVAKLFLAVSDPEISSQPGDGEDREHD